MIYAEIRFARFFILPKTYPYEVVLTGHEATAEGIAATGVEARLILCTLRHYFEEQSMETVCNWLINSKGTNVVGFDIAGDEAGYPIDSHVAAFAYAEKNIPCTAMQVKPVALPACMGNFNHFHPSRIGHGVRSAEDENCWIT